MSNAVATSSTSTQPAVKPKSPPPFRMSSVNKGSKWLKILVYGKQGAGKTTLAASAADIPDMQGVFMINAESGDMVLEDNSRVEHPENVALAEVNNFKQVAKMHEFLTSHCKFRDNPTEENIAKMRKYEAMLYGVEEEDIVEPQRFNTVIIDSLTEVEAYCMYGLLGINGEFDMAMIDDDMKTAEFSEYKKNNNMVNLLVRAFRDLPMHVIIICGQEYAQDEVKRYHYFPALTGKLRTQVQAYFDIVGYLTVGQATEGSEQPRRLYVQPTSSGTRFDAKNRRASFKGTHFDNPTMKSILAAVGLMQKPKKESEDATDNK